MNQTHSLHPVQSPAVRISYYLGRSTAALIVFSSSCVFLYCALLLMTVTHATAQHQSQVEMRGLVSEISDLESQYLAQTQSITDDRGIELGLTKPITVATIYTQAGGRQLSLQTVQ